MSRARAVARGLAALQAADLVATQVSPRYGDAHLDHLGVPRWLRPVLPGVKLAIVAGLVAAAARPRARSAVGAALVAYYSAAVTFHVRSGDGVAEAAPAAACGVLAASLLLPDLR